MGVSTDGIIFYGYVWGEDIDLFDGRVEDNDWQAFLAKRNGAVDPWDTFPNEEVATAEKSGGYRAGRPLTDAWIANNKEAIDAWNEAKKSVEMGCYIDFHGSSEWRCPFVDVRDSHVAASRGYPQDISALIGAGAKEEWDAQLLAFCESLDIDLSEAEGPSWFLVSYWG